MSSVLIEEISFVIYTIAVSALLAFMICYYQKLDSKYSKFTRLTCLIFSILSSSVMYVSVAYKFLRATQVLESTEQTEHLEFNVDVPEKDKAL